MTKFGHLCTLTNPKNPGYITVALTRPSKDDADQKHFVAFSFCSPKDTFSKKKGRLITEGRLSSGRVMEINIRGTVSSVIKASVQKAVLEGLVPSWVAKAYKQNKLNYSLSKKTENYPLGFVETCNKDSKE